MTSSARNHLLALAAAAAALGVPSVADAATFCVGPVDCPAGGIAKGDDLQAALKDSGELGFDTILIADKGSPYVGPFHFEARSQQTEGQPPPLVDIKAVGDSRPTLTGPAGRTVLSLSRARLSGVEIVRPDRTTPGLGVTNSTVMDVEVVRSGPEGPGGFAVLLGGATIVEDTWVGGLSDEGFIVSPGSDVQATRIHTEGPDVGIRVAATARLRLERSRIDARLVALAGKGKNEVRHSTLVTRKAGASGIQQLDGSLLLDHVTIAHRGSDFTSPAIDLGATVPTNATLRAVAIGGYTRGFRRVVDGSGSYAVTAVDSVWDSSGDQLDDTTGGRGVRDGVIDAEPRFADRLGGDLRPVAGAPQIDADRSIDATYRDLLVAGASDGDGDGIARADAGALELVVPAPPQAPPPPGPAAAPAVAVAAPGVPVRAAIAPTADRRAPRITRVRLTKGLRLAFRVDEAATVRIRSGKLTLVRKVGPGERSIALRSVLKRRGLLRGRRVRISVTAADAAGNRSRAKTLRRAIARR